MAETNNTGKYKFRPLIWTDGAEPSINAANLQRYDDALNTLLGAAKDSGDNYLDEYSNDAIVPKLEKSATEHEDRLDKAEINVNTNKDNISALQTYWEDFRMGEFIISCGSAKDMISSEESNS